MALTVRQRLTMIKECATILDKDDYEEIDLVLGQHQLPTSDFYPGDTRRAYVIQMIKDAGDEALVALHSYLQDEAGSGLLEDSPFAGEAVRVFFSHLAIHRDLVGDVGQVLDEFGVQAFVAHDDIEPSKQWQAVIESALRDCDAMVVFLHEGFAESAWCDQEVGWVMGRNRPILPLWFDVGPQGFLGKFQAPKVSNRPSRDVGRTIMRWLISLPSLHGRLAPGIARAFAASRSYEFTRTAAAMLQQMRAIDDDNLDLMVDAAFRNNQVSDAVIENRPGPEWVRDFVGTHRTPAQQAADPWAGATDPPF